MAKVSKSVSFKNAMIEIEENGQLTIIEIAKDDALDYNLTQVLQEWAGIEGISLSLKIDEEMASIDNSSDKGD